ncbi:cell division control protein 1 [Aplysia californica]|uniref:Cell division control protein 1 n=1 Tax=Aplysia californica TaxID=6500 RepID=A0ABM1VX19_APLCA|nr:cell division control protein 1 [Aplysia californica]
MVSLLIMQRRFRNLSIQKVAFALVIIVVAFNEFLVYSFQTFRWTRISKDRAPTEEMVVLFASDPQLIGVQDELGFPIGSIARWDSDRYLQKTFSRAYAHTQPDVIVFLGDIMDEGSKATEAEYQSYLQRFHSIFPETKITKTVIIPGDNDIGGEGRDFRTPFKVDRFEKHFENLTGVVKHGFIDFMKLDIRLNVDKVLETKRLISNLAPKLKEPLRIIINHETVMSKMKGTIYPILRMAQPNILFTGHWHVSEMFECGTCLSENEDIDHWPYNLRGLKNIKDFIEVDLTNLIGVNEILVPTCSYRMGEPNMGYGVAHIERSGRLRYTVLWLPARYTLLYIYVVALVIVSVLLLVSFVTAPRSKVRPPSSYR